MNPMDSSERLELFKKAGLALMDMGWNGDTEEDMQRVIKDWRKYQVDAVSARSYADELIGHKFDRPFNPLWDTQDPATHIRDQHIRKQREAINHAIDFAAADAGRQLTSTYVLVLAGLQVMIDMLVNHDHWTHASKNVVLRGARELIRKALYELNCKYPSTAGNAALADDIPF